MMATGNMHSPVLGGTAAVLVIVLATLGIAVFTGLIPGAVVHQDAYDVAAGGVMPVADSEPRCRGCGVIKRIRPDHASPATGGVGDERESRESRYRITLRTWDGGSRELTVTGAPAFAVGDRVRIDDSGALVSAGSVQD